ncbi:MAG: hypothetical protein U1F54_12260 [Burkholderiales bacterium]
MERFRNRSAAFLWGFAVVWLGSLVLFTYVLVRDGAPAPHSPFLIGAIFVVFWLFGLGLIAFAAAHPCTSVAVDGGRVLATWRYPHRTERQSYPAAHVPPAQVVRERDSDGDTYFFARVTLSEGRILDLSESHNRGACERNCKRFNAALARGGDA